ncbi:MAG: hypothetical protein ABJC10_06880 [Acidobacteriota bacterium]
MKIKRTIFFVLSVLVLVTSLTSGAAGKGLVPQNTPDAAHTLSDAQKQAIKRIHVKAELQAALPTLRLARVVRQIYTNMLADKPDEKLRVKLAAELKEVTWPLLAIKGKAIRQTVNVLTPAQKQLVRTEMAKPGAPADLYEVVAHTFNLSEK